MNNKTHKKRKGGCGCNSIKVGGKNRKSRRVIKRRKTGGNNLAQLPLRYYYPYNENPSYLTGGKKRRVKLLNVKGGNYIYSLGNATGLIGLINPQATVL